MNKDIRAKLNIIGENINNLSFLVSSCGIDRVEKEGFYLLNYGITSKTSPINRLCRGTVFSKTGELMCLPLIRFFNIHESTADNVDWRYCHVLEKLDGSLVSAWHDGEQWRLSTKRMVDDLTISQWNSNKTFNLSDCFVFFFPDFEDYLDPKYWYIFECVSPHNRIVTAYSDEECGNYLLSIRNKRTLKELGWNSVVKTCKSWGVKQVRTPKVFNIDNYGEVTKLFGGMPSDYEGVVVVDKFHKRVKIKQKSYVHLHHIISNVSSRRNLIDLILGGEESEILSYFPDLQDKFDEISRRINKLKEDISVVFGLHNHLKTQKEFALAVKDLNYSYFLFRMRRGDDLKFIFNQMTGKRLEQFIFTEDE